MPAVHDVIQLLQLRAVGDHHFAARLGRGHGCGQLRRHAAGAKLRAAAAAEGVPFSADCEGGMFGFFLLPELPQNYAQVLRTDNARFNTLFHGLLDRGVYIAPALYEAGFVSGAHTASDIETTVAAAREVFKKLSKI